MPKITITMKDPDTLYDAIMEAAEEDARKIEGIDDDERQAIVEQRKEKFAEVAKKWFEYSEYLRVQIDTDAGTCTVLEVN